MPSNPRTKPSRPPPLPSSPTHPDPPCQHTHLLITPSPYASTSNYTTPLPSTLAKAQGLKPTTFTHQPTTFPAPLILPGDDLALDPKHPPQSLLSWTRLKSRNPVTPERRTIYLIPPPGIDDSVSFADTWIRPRGVPGDNVDGIDVGTLADYLRAFYHPLPVQVMPESTLSFTRWDDETTSSSSSAHKQQFIGFRTHSEMLGIRTRKTRNKAVFATQLNLDDLLEGVVAVVPGDALAVVLLVRHDLFEDEEDEFVCGRAYGGSRVAVVSSARYIPGLDGGLGLDCGHGWPLSHCGRFVRGLLGEGKRGRGSEGEEMQGVAVGVDSPLGAAVGAVVVLRERCSGMKSQVRSVPCSFLSRLCRTVSHELGHCFGIDHCTYYACVMQGSASLLEDHRQPLYLCPVDMVKVLRATGATEEQWISAMIEFCERFAYDETFVALGAWLKARSSV